MKRILAISMLFIAISTSSSNGATIHLKDGSVVRGDISKLNNGVYSVSSDALGQISIPQREIESIEYGQSDVGRSGGASDATTEISKIQQSLISDPETMIMIQGLAGDPQLQEILADPAIMRAVAAGDINTLMANEKFMQLMNNTNIKAITDKVTNPQ